MRSHQFDSVATPQVMDHLVRRECARSDRNGRVFSLVLFRVPTGRRRRTMAMHRLARVMLKRARFTDEVGWMGESHLAALLPDTDAQGAQAFADGVSTTVARRQPRPLAIIYSYPRDAIAGTLNPDDRRRQNGNGSGNGSLPATTRINGNGHPKSHSDGNGHGINGNGHPKSHSDGNSHGTNGNGHPKSHSDGNGHGTNGNGHHPHGNGHTGPNGNGHGHAESNGNGHGHARMNGNANGHSRFNGNGATAVLERVEMATEPAPLRIAAKPRRAEVPVAELEELLAYPMPRWKRLSDIAGAITLLIVLAPVMLIAAIAVKLSSSGPVLFWQRRSGLGGKPFKICKFRTMCVNAEKQQQELRKLNEQDGPAFKLTADPRVTRIGAILRKTSIDELPQLWNVLRGEMSLVGPRPLPISEQEACEQWQRHRLNVTPGLTCIWQVKGRSSVTFAEWVRMDVAYMRRRTILHDFSILMSTIPAVLLRRGAR